VIWGDPLAEPREVMVVNDDVTLAGSVWIPTHRPPLGGVLMHPGSGASDRHNGGYFAPIRTALVEAGYAVASFDKRGVGGSSGLWQEAPIETQARDMMSGVALLAEQPEMSQVPIGLFGHGQGAWVAMEAAAREEDILFVILNSGSAVSPVEQERYAARNRLARSTADPEEVEKRIARYDLMVRLARALTPYEQVEERLEELSPHVPKNQSIWHFWISILDYAPRSALSRAHAPFLALYGENDRLVPIEASIEVLRSTVPPNRLSVEVFPEADHWIRVGDPPELARGYVETVLGFLESHSQS
jgi:pimeloyl-ACP methyl ester carboxylesterase